MTPASKQKRRPRKSAEGNREQVPGLGSRLAAAKLLSAIVDRRASMDGLLDPQNGNPAWRALSEQDRSLVRAILQAALRNLPIIDAFIDLLVARPLPEGAVALRHTLRIAAAQILFLDIPAHAAVNIAVEMARGDPRNRRFVALVNALLRQMIRQKDEELPRLQSRVINAPAWLGELIESAYPEHASAIFEAHRHPPAIDLTVKSDSESWAARLGGRVTPTGSVRLGHVDGPITDLEGFADGEWWVQDVAASIPARLFGEISGWRVADLCAAPGGKTAQLALAGASVTALDFSANRLKRLDENLKRLKLDAECVHADLFEWQPGEAFDAVLLDAPCSSTGTIRRHPDIPWTKSPSDVAKLADLQERMLARALTLVRPGGMVVFSNCSLAKEEGEDVVSAILESHPKVDRRAVESALIPGLEDAISPEGDLRTTPDMLPDPDPAYAGLDGFFASILMRLS
ncbi:transcription antitermination factor NusB [Flavimaribacter sediminis]|uniref:transcription antitermination factor NusB n=1 Tax=Flavimaribacter sediminis TaxID=2865987 RepID=UPI00351EF482